MKEFDPTDIKLPDPYSYPNEYYQVFIPGPAPELITNTNNIPETVDITHKVATYKKAVYIEANKSRTIKWILVSYQ